MGANGSGKSTVARLACGHVTPTAGTVLRRRVAYVAQDPQANIVAERVGADVAFGIGTDAEVGEQDRRVRRALEIVDMLWAIDRPMSSLSGGELQRVALAGAVAARAELLILDEPTAHLPPREARLFWEAVQSSSSVHSPGILYATHRPQEARFAHRVAVLSYGRVALAGPPGEVMWRFDLLDVLGVRPDVALGAWRILQGGRSDGPIPDDLDERVKDALCSALTR